MEDQNSEFDKLEEKIKKLSVQIHKCTKFEKFAEPDECACGLSRDDHGKIEDEEESNEDEIRWERSSNTITAGRTDAYGRVKFNGQRNLAAEYLRLSFDTGEETFERIIKDIWGLQKPELALFIIGSCNDDRSIRFVDTFIETALVTDKFVVTEGCHAGVAKIFAEKAAKMNKAFSYIDKLKIVGVPHWGTLRNRKSLLNNSPEIEQKMERNYKIDIGIEDRNSLDLNHTHFLLVDDAAYRNGITDGSINLVAKFLSGIGAVVTVAFDEKINTIKTVLRNIQYGIPCIMITDTHQLKTLLDNALKKLNDRHKEFDSGQKAALREEFSNVFFASEDKDDEFKNMHEKIQKRYNTKILESFTKACQILMESGNKKLFVQLDLNTSQRELKKIIIQIYAANAKDNGILGKVLIKWKQDALYEQYILSKTKIPDDELLQILIDSVIQNNLDFVKLLLKILLNSNAKNKIEEEITKKIKNSSFIENILKKVLDDNKFCFNSRSYFVNSLFLVASALGKYETALYLASVDDYPLANYFIGVKIFRHIRSIYLSGSMQRVITQAISSFEHAACDLFEEVYEESELKAYQLLFAPTPVYNNKNCIKLAEWVECLNFLSIKAVMHVFESTYSYGKQFSLFFTRQEQNKREVKKVQAKRTDVEANYDGAKNSIEIEKKKLLDTQQNKALEEPDKQKPRRKRGFWKFFWLLRMPKIKYILYYISFFNFLGLFAYVLVANFYPKGYKGPSFKENHTVSLRENYTVPSVEEILVNVWISSIIFDGIYIIFIKWLELDDPFPMNGETFKYIVTNPKIYAVALYLVGMTLRFIPSLNCYYAARVVLSIDYIVWIVELFEGLKGSRRIGIFFVMIQKMSLQTWKFMLLIFIVIFAHGVSTQALMFPNQRGPDGRSFRQVFGNIFFPSFFVIVGNELSFEQIVTFGDCPYKDSRNTTYEYVNDLNDEKNRCPDEVGSKWAMAIHIVYLITLVILFLNLLIAILNNIYEGIQNESEKKYNLLFVGHSNKYRFLKTLLPPPLNLLWIPYLIYFISQNDKLEARRGKGKNEKIEYLRLFKRYDAEAILMNVDQEKLVGYKNYYDALYSPKSQQDLINYTGYHAEKVFWKIHEEEKNKDQEKEKEKNIEGFNSE